MDFIQSLDNVTQAIENNNIKTVAGKSKLSIIVENRYEIFITHYPLWSNEGFLYLGKGDLGRPENAYQIDKKHIGIIRIDVDNQGEPVSTPIHKQPLNGVTKGYFIPKNNPFYARKDILPEHYSIGLRNPFRIYYDKKTNDKVKNDK